jgi:uncharacterized metal-binding protein
VFTLIIGIDIAKRNHEATAIDDAGQILGRITFANSNAGAAKLLDFIARVESAGYRVWPRVREIMEFSRHAGFKRLGLPFCVGLRREALEVTKIFESNGFEVVSVMCKTGSRPKEELGLLDQEKVRPGRHEAMCNPIAQALILNKLKTGLNVLLGLCVGHDTLFIKYSDAPITVLAVKDRVTGHNPLAAVYATHYFEPKLKLT